MNTNALMLNVRAAKNPSKKELRYEFTTTEVKNYLQEKFNAIEKALNASGNKAPHVDIGLISADIGVGFQPFCIVLPDLVLDKKNSNDSIPSCFQIDESDGVKIKPHYYKLLQAYAYSDRDRAAMMSGEWRNARGIKNKNVAQGFMTYTKAKIETSGGRGNNNTVILMLDPVRVFHDMLTDADNVGQRFKVVDIDTKSINDEVFLYTMTREVVSRNKSEKVDLRALIRKASYGKRD